MQPSAAVLRHEDDGKQQEWWVNEVERDFAEPRFGDFFAISPRG